MTISNYEKFIRGYSVQDSVCNYLIEEEIRSKFGEDVFKGLNPEEKEAIIDVSLKLMGKTRDQIINESELTIKELSTAVRDTMNKIRYYITNQDE